MNVSDLDTGLTVNRRADFVGGILKNLRYRTKRIVYFNLSSGFRVNLDHFMMGHADALLDQDQSDHHAAFAPLIQRLFPDAAYSVVPTPSRERQGAIACVACFTTVEHQPDDDALGSSLTLGWYVDHMDRPVRDIIRIGLDLCDWNASCEPMYWT